MAENGKVFDGNSFRYSLYCTVTHFSSISFVNNQSPFFLELLSNTDVCSSLTSVDHLNKRKRDDEEASGSKQENPTPFTKRRRHLDGGEG